MQKYILYSFATVLTLANVSVARAACNPTGTSCAACTTYRCNAGYYGTATSGSGGCTVCPANASCSGGNGSTFICNQGYYKSGSACARCPASGGVYGTTKSTGATSITACYIPSGTAFTDTGGSGSYTGDCYYTN